MTLAAKVSGKVFAAVCPKAPPGMQNYQDQVTSWIKWGVLALIIAAALVSIGSILVGRIFSHPHAPATARWAWPSPCARSCT
jgi:hypothetical protein